ncbi:MAG: hypothetical protein JSS50_01690 [Proteobacteria bacterium]|nr:hypothetical protein [Pseudomonadota bacterium]
MTIHRLHSIKKEFPVILEQSKGIISIACRKAGIERKTYYNWCSKDWEFAAKCDDVLELAADMVEYALLQKIDKGDTTAMIFYLKTKCKHRGYTERIERVQATQPKS